MMMMKRCRSRIQSPAATEASSDDNHHVYLPLELLIEILARLPLKALLRFRRVCKTWCLIVEDPNFAVTHVKQHSRSDRPLFVYRIESLFNTDKMWQLHFESWSGDAFAKLSDFTLPWESSNRDECISVKSYVHGLVLLYITRSVCVHVLEIKLWNPSIKRSLDLRLPDGFGPFRVPCHNKDFIQLDLGYDPVSKDYKVLAFIRDLDLHMFARDLPSYARFLIDPDVESEDSKVFIDPPAFVQVHTVGTGIWRNITLLEGQYNSDDDKGCFWWNVESPAYLNGVIYWIGLDSRIKLPVRFKSARIISFDMGAEAFDWTIKFPTEVTEHNRLAPKYRNVLGAMGESLVFMKRTEAHISIWLMDRRRSSGTVVKEHNTWSMFWTIDAQPVRCPGEHSWNRITNSGLLFASHCEYPDTYPNTSYDVKCRRFRNHYRKLGGNIVLNDYMESLALLKKGNAYELT